MKRIPALVALICSLSICGPLSAELPALFKSAKRIVFLGDSITDAGTYIVMIESHLRALPGGEKIELVNLGLPSETCSGLSEPDHPFPRPDVHERLDRVLAKTKPDVVVACYGMNDGIYYPFAESRFKAYQSGLQRLIKKVKASGAKLILCTPPAFDPLPMKKKGKLLPLGAKKYAWFSIYEDYDDVMRRYAKWVLGQRPNVDFVIDLHTPVSSFLAGKRKSDPDFVMSGDGVHVNNDGHRVLANAIMKSLKIPASKPSPELYALLAKRQAVTHASWLSHVGHKRPGVKPGLKLEKAQRQAAEIEKRIQALK